MRALWHYDIIMTMIRLYLYYISQVMKMTRQSDPTELLLSHRVIQYAGAYCLLSIVYIVYSIYCQLSILSIIYCLLFGLHLMLRHAGEWPHVAPGWPSQMLLIKLPHADLLYASSIACCPLSCQEGFVHRADKPVEIFQEVSWVSLILSDWRHKIVDTCSAYS